MASEKHRRAAAGLLANQGRADEELLGAAPAWVARVGPKGHVFFVGRHRALVALTDQGLVAWRHAKRRPTATVDVPLSALRLRGEHSARPFFQVLARVQSEAGRETVVLEFRHRDHAFARAVGRAISGTAGAANGALTSPA